MRFAVDLFIAALGLVVILSPDRVLALVKRAQSQLGLWFIAGPVHERTQ